MTFQYSKLPGHAYTIRTVVSLQDKRSINQDTHWLGRLYADSFANNKIVLGH